MEAGPGCDSCGGRDHHRDHSSSSAVIPNVEGTGNRGPPNGSRKQNPSCPTGVKRIAGPKPCKGDT